jgi:hypothetical protein
MSAMSQRMSVMVSVLLGLWARDLAMDGVPADQREIARWVILVAREEGELYAHLRAAFAGDPKVRVILDRRTDESRNAPRVNDRLHTARVVIIPVSP